MTEPTLQPSPDLRAKILASAKAAPSPTRANLVRRRFVAAVLALAWLVLVVMLGHVRPEAAGLVLLVAWLLAAMATTAYVLGPARRFGRPRRALALVGPIIGALIVASAWGAGMLLGHSNDRHAGEGICWLLTVGVGLVPLALGLWVERRSDPIAPGKSAAALGAIAGAWAGVAMSFVCGRSETMHVFVGHVAALLATVALAALVGRRVLMLR